MVSDFYYPNVGGVENHLHFLSLQLISMGHTIVIVTHAYPDKDVFSGIVTTKDGIKVYYLNLWVLYSQCTMPNIGLNLHIYRYKSINAGAYS
jgi:phosphatidylinositol N-acetylglucosaminyltransferase subunit A